MARSRAAVVAVLVAASLGGWWLGRHDAAPLSGRLSGRLSGPLSGRVVEAIDGDTVRVAVGERTETVRVLGIDTPETHHPDRPVECFGPEAAAYTAARLVGREVVLELDVETRDRYGRLLAHVVVDGVRFGDELLRLGYARVLVVPPNGAHGRAQLALEIEARRARRGLWGAC